MYLNVMRGRRYGGQQRSSRVDWILKLSVKCLTIIILSEYLVMEDIQEGIEGIVNHVKGEKEYAAKSIEEMEITMTKVRWII